MQICNSFTFTWPSDKAANEKKMLCVHTNIQFSTARHFLWGRLIISPFQDLCYHDKYEVIIYGCLFFPVCNGVKCVCCYWQIQQDCQITREDTYDTLVIEGFRFESTASRESLQRLCSQDGSGCHFRRATRDWWRPRPFQSDSVVRVKGLTEVTTAGRWESASSAHDKTETKHDDPSWAWRVPLNM